MAIGYAKTLHNHRYSFASLVLSKSAKKKYECWGDANLTLWSCILDALDDPSVRRLIEQVEKYTRIPAGASGGEFRRTGSRRAA